ncbi:hypothetical protein BEQ56_04565 [Anaerolineaceae bacterium oral taxon 439]|nr:hypothetical protein BEQ56_04565 [Anaerolineaceae bacterium oral taxon 439]
MFIPLQYLGMGSAEFPLKDNRFIWVFYQKTAVEIRTPLFFSARTVWPNRVLNPARHSLTTLQRNKTNRPHEAAGSDPTKPLE